MNYVDLVAVLAVEQLEPISKFPEQQKYRRNLYKSEEILGM